MAESWKPIYLSAKVFGHLSQGLYRTPAGAIKELISNSHDADATLVRIHTGFPRFQTFSCEDNGAGMSIIEFDRLMNHGIGSSYKRLTMDAVTVEHNRPLVGRLGLGILALAQICTRFEIASHHEESKSAFRATIKFPPYTRQEMDKLTARLKGVHDDAQIHGGEFTIREERFDPEKRGVRVFTQYLREAFHKRMTSTLPRFANATRSGVSEPYRTFAHYLRAIYNVAKPTPSLNLLSDYDQLLFGLALAPPLPLIEDRNLAVGLPMIGERQSRLRAFAFEVQVDNLKLTNPLYLPSDREEHTASDCRVTGSETKSFTLLDGPVKQPCAVVQHNVRVANSDLQYHLYEIRYAERGRCWQSS